MYQEGLIKSAYRNPLVMSFQIEQLEANRGDYIDSKEFIESEVFDLR